MQSNQFYVNGIISNRGFYDPPIEKPPVEEPLAFFKSPIAGRIVLYGVFATVILLLLMNSHNRRQFIEQFCTHENKSKSGRYCLDCGERLKK